MKWLCTQAGANQSRPIFPDNREINLPIRERSYLNREVCTQLPDVSAYETDYYQVCCASLLLAGTITHWFKKMGEEQKTNYHPTTNGGKIEAATNVRIAINAWQFRKIQLQ